MAIKKVQFSIEGMHCGSCAAGIQMVLQNVEGVVNVSADYNAKKGEVEFDDEKVKFDDLMNSVADLGYKTTII